VYAVYGDSKPSKLVAGFDMDFTIIKPKNGKKFPVNGDDWEFWHANVTPKLKDLHKKGYRVVVFTN
jgi:bifunctional polynucleotide phosphatase/kinase